MHNALLRTRAISIFITRNKKKKYKRKKENGFHDFQYFKKKRGVSYSYRTATTSHLCFVPDLEDSEGAGRKRLTPTQK